MLGAALAAGCGRPAPPLRAGDEVRLELAYAPKAPWTAGARIDVGMLIQIHRAGRMTYLMDPDGSGATMRARITFGGAGEPLDVPFVRDC